MEEVQLSLAPHDRLCLPQPRRLLHEKAVTLDGEKILHLYYGDLEITFDDPSLVSFGENLLVTSQFTARDTIGWGGTELYAWETVKELLETLVSQGLLKVQESAPEPPAAAPTTRGCPVAHGATASAPDPRANARWWSRAECVALSQEIFGVPVEVGNLESLVRAARIAHPALDVAGRQLGDENVYPPQLRLEIPTEHRSCSYRGSRYQHELPMNVTGLKLIQGCWSDVLQGLRITKREFLRRRAPSKPTMSLVELYIYATSVLSLPSYLMHRASDPVRNGQIPIAVSALYRAIDGTRITSRHMLLTGDPPHAADVVPGVDKFFLHAERELLLLTGRGVCAGPPGMIEEFLGHVMDVAPEEELIDTVPLPAFSEVSSSMDYALAACELEATVDQFWLQQLLVIERLYEHVTRSARTEGVNETLRSRLAASLSAEAVTHIISHLHVNPTATARRSVYDTFSTVVDICRGMRNLPLASPIAFGDLGDDNDPRIATFRQFFLEHVPDVDPVTSGELALALARLLTLEERALPAMAARQAEVNGILGRAPASRAFSAADLARAWSRASLRSILCETLGISLVTREGETTLVRAAAADAVESRSSTLPALVDPIVLADPGFASLRKLFARSRYSLESVLWRLCGRTVDSPLEGAAALQNLTTTPQDLTEPIGDALDVLIRLFMVPARVPREALARLLRADELQALFESGLVDVRDDFATSPFSMGTIDGLYFLTDTAQTIRERRVADVAGGAPEASPNALVMPAYAETYLFAAKTHRHPTEWALDLCTGSGVHALLASRYSKHVAASDISARAIRFAAWNKRLNGIDNVEFATGSVWEPWFARRFDKITVNPPYQPDSRQRPGQNWWGAGPRGSGIVSLILGGLTDHLTDEGELQMVGQISSWDEDGDLERPILRAVGPSRDRFDVRLDVDETPLSEYRRRYPGEPLTGLVRTAYGVVTLTRRG